VFLHTPLFFLFFAVVCLVYWLLPRPSWRKAFLLLAGYGFYAAFDVRFLIVLLTLTAATYVLGLAVGRAANPRGLVLFSLAIDFGALAYFKYANFFLENAETLLRGLGAEPSAAIRILLPIGISFYSFQAVAYILEIARRHIPAAENILDLGLYLGFFPKLIAGPFVRPADFLHRVADPPRTLSRSDAAASLQRLVTGLFKKVVIADSVAALADVSFRAAASPNSAGFPMPLYVAGFYLYAVQIYADFSGYTDLALGSAGLLGISLPENFRCPYFSLSPADFWNRWHITLSQWFREYVFFPLSRRGMIATRRRYPRVVQTAANLITMTLVGLWHGAAWTFVLWGMWHGVLLSVDRLVNLRPVRWWTKVVSAVVTFHLVGAGWILFRASSPAEAWRFLAGLVSFRQPIWFAAFLPRSLLALFLMLGIDAAGSLPGRFGKWVHAMRPAGIAAAVFLVAAMWILQAVSQSPAPPFIYGAF
jgi:alginate O-acetyltransferase complex protein AlgI